MKKNRSSYILAFFLLFAGIFALISLYGEGVAKQMNLGLDLQGGFEVLYEVNTFDSEQAVTPEVLSSTVDSLRKRIDVIGVSEPNLQIEGKDRVRVQLAGVSDQETARELLSTQAKLTFRDVNDNILLDGADLKEGGAQVIFSEANTPWVSIKLKDAEVFKKATERTMGSQLVIWLDYEEGDSYQTEMLKEDTKIISAPSVSEVLNTKEVVIQGTFLLEEATQLANLLNSGSLPVELKEIYSTSVSAQFGEDALAETTLAAGVGVLLIFLYMLFTYRFSGMISVITLSAYIFLILLVFNWMGAVLTLPGIAALVLGVGMAVDANILTFERMREELIEGNSLKKAFKLGNKNSLSTIVDANITTLLAAGTLFMFGTSSVKGFALMLIISILTSFVTAVYGSRLMLGLWIKSGVLDGKTHWFKGGGKK